MTASSTQPSVPAPDKGKPELLIVADDDTDIARFVEMNLKLQGYEVIVANDGATALALIQEHQPALAIVDLMMPNIDGIELTRRRSWRRCARHGDATRSTGRSRR